MLLDKPLITTIIPTYQRPKLLRRAILSVLNQHYQNFQVWVYDNASGDETADVVADIAKRDNRVKYYCHATNIGAVANFNYGIERVDTPLFSILSDDDVVLPDFYTEALSGLEKHPDAMFSAGAVVNMTQDGAVIGVALSSWERDGYYCAPEGLFTMLRAGHPIMTAILFRREIIDIYGGIDPDIVISDLDLELRIAARFPFVISQKPCGIFVAHPSSGGIQADSSWIWPSGLKVIQNIRNDTFISHDVIEKAEGMLMSYFKKTIFTLGLRSAIRGDFKDAYKAASVLGEHYQKHMKSSILYSIARIFEQAPLINKLALLGYTSLSTIYKIKNAGIQKEFGHLYSFLKF